MRFPVSNTGVLQLIPRPVVGVPNGAFYNAGLAFDPQTGAIYWDDIAYVRSDDVFVNGVRCTSDGAIYTTETAAATDTWNAGRRISATGALVVTVAAITGTPSFMEGVAYSSNGAAYCTKWPFSDVTEIWDARYGVTSSGELVSSWVGLRGLYTLSAAGGAQPIILPYSGTNYLWLPGVAGNAASTPDSAALDITGSFDVDVFVACDDWTPASGEFFVGKDVINKRSFSFGLNGSSNGNLYVETYDSAGTAKSFTSSVATAVADFAAKYVRAKVTWALAGNITCDFYLSSDGVTWTTLGTQQTAAATGNALGNYDNALYIGQREYGGAESPTLGKIYRARLYSGDRDAGGTLAFSADFRTVSEGATTFTESSSNGATVTINSTGAKPAQIVGSQSLLGDGAAYYLQTGAFARNQGHTAIVVAKSITHSAPDAIIDGLVLNTAKIEQFGASPGLAQYAGGAVDANRNTGAALNSYAVIAAVFNGASSSMTINTTTVNGENPGTSNASGLTVFSAGDLASYFWNGQIKSIALCNTALSATPLTNQINALDTQFEVF